MKKESFTGKIQNTIMNLRYGNDISDKDFLFKRYTEIKNKIGNNSSPELKMFLTEFEKAIELDSIAISRLLFSIRNNKILLEKLRNIGEENIPELIDILSGINADIIKNKVEKSGLRF